ncbi:MAG: aminotransferase class V-fold PLP-dependent enzyme [Bacteroidia bacterium]|nr:aminotransferase class V-fold PLP-dependent enzyme [Bacteroidia bacterium]
MKSNSRRKFLRSLSTGVSASILLPGLTIADSAGFFEDTLHKLNKIADPRSEAYWETIKSQFEFTDGLKYFNNASLGGSSIPIRNATRAYRDTLDAFPSKYMWGGWKDEKEETREAVARLFSVSSEEIALIHNTTEGMNLIARSFDLEPGDEVVLADHEHSSGRIPWEVWQETKGIHLVRPTLPILPKDVNDLVKVYEDAITPRTKVISMCHIVNTNGMMLPVKEVSEMAHERGILVAVDGAQSAGMYKIDLNDLGCDFYAASSHKWLFSPKGVGVFYARQESQKHLRPLIVARGHRDDSIRRLENYNTRNLPEVLGLGAAVNFINEIGIDKIHDRTFDLKAYFREKINTHPKLILKTPASDQLSGAIQVVEVQGRGVAEAKNILIEDYNIDCRPMSGFDLNALRISLAIYITKSDIDYLINALSEITDS